LLVLVRLTCALVAIAACFGQATDAGRRQFESRCTACHGVDANGGEHGPAIAAQLAGHTDPELAAIVRQGFPASGMPAFTLSDAEMEQLVGYLRTLEPRDAPPVHRRVETTAGEILEGSLLGEGYDDLQLLTGDQRVHLLRKSGKRYRPVTSQSGWPTYHGNLNGNRYSPLVQINKANVGRLAPEWVFNLPNTSNLQVTPVVADGIMYVTATNECYALDAGSGRQVWHYQRPRTRGLVGNAAGGVNRGAAVAGERVFMVTDNAHLIALNRSTGAPEWDTEMADWRLNYNATSAPLVAGNLVVSGTAGGDEGVRGFVAAFDQATGAPVWRFWTVPRPGEPGSETWKGTGIEHPSAAAWFTGSYDQQLALIYWQTGNPGPDFNGDARGGDNLYSDSTVALDAKTGKLKWYFQYTPHDVWDWDAAQPEVLVDALWQGQPRKLLLHANRNGFFYVLDRTNGRLLLGKAFVHKLTWAKEIGPDGRPVLNGDKAPTPAGTAVCPPIEGATNWFSTSFSPITGLYYVQTLEKCGIFTKIIAPWQAGRGYMGGGTRNDPGDTPQKILRAIDIRTGKIAWELPETGPGNSWGGVLSTASGIVFLGDDSGAFVAADAATGKPLWHFPGSGLWKASPMTYSFDGKQYVAIASGANIISFALFSSQNPK
jgi:alcohol dehydrogenase (cytochrome c)